MNLEEERGIVKYDYKEIMVLVYSMFLFKKVIYVCSVPSLSSLLPRIKLLLKKY